MNNSLLKKQFFYFFLFLLQSQAFAQFGSVDTSFNTADAGFGQGDGANSYIQTSVVQANSQIIIAGGFTAYNGTPKRGIARLNSDGSLDTTFDAGTSALNIRAVAVQSDGKILVGGSFGSFNGSNYANIVRLNVDGSIDGSFNVGTGANGEVRTILIQPDNKILIGGGFSSYNQVGRSGLVRLNTDGSFDAGFYTGNGFNNVVYSIALQADGKIIVGGSFTWYDQGTKNRIARLNANGSNDATFVTGTGTNGIYITKVLLQTDGKVLFFGDFTTYNGTSRSSAARINTNGTIDATFSSGTGAIGVIWSAALMSDGKILVGGTFTSFNGTGINRFAKINSNGTLDSGFNVGSGCENTVWSFSILPDSKILISGYFKSYNATSRNYIFRINSDASNDLTFNPTGFGANSTVKYIVRQVDGKILVGGRFSTFNGQTQNGIVRLNADGSSDNSFSGSVDALGEVHSISIQSDGKIIIAGYFTTYNGVTRNNIARLNTDGSLDGSFNPGSGSNTYIYTTAIQSDGKILIGGSFTLFNGTPKNYITRLNTNGSLDSGFSGTGANSLVFSMLIQPDNNIIIAGFFTSYNGSGANRIVRLNPNGTLDSGFTPPFPNSSISKMALQTDGKIIIGGYFTTLNSTPNNLLARLNQNGTWDTGFTTSGNVGTNVDAISIQADGKVIVGGLFTVINGISSNNITRLNLNGSTDLSFALGSGASWSVNSLCIQPDGRILSGGDFISFNGTGKNRIIRLMEDLTLTTSVNAISPYCVGESINVQYNASGTYHPGNTFTAEISDAAGSFASAQTIGSLSSQLSGSISAVFPANLIQGTGYRIRVISSIPAFVGSDNGTDLTINPLPMPVITSNTPACGAELLSSSSGIGYLWSNTETTQTISAATNGIYSVQVTDANGCVSDPVQMNVSIIPCVPCVIPASLSTSNVTHSSALFSWDPTITGDHFLIRYWKNGATLPGGFEYTSAPGLAPSSPLSINGLLPGTQYYIQIKTVCTLGNYSKYSQPHSFTTMNGFLPCIKPFDVHASSISATSAMISWNPIVTADTFKVRYAVMGTSLPYNYKYKTISGFPNVSSIQLTNLDPGTQYVFSVMTICSGIKSRYSTNINFTTNPLPGSEPVIKSISAQSESGFSFLIFPNPIRDILKVKFEGNTADKYDLVINDVSGRVVFSKLALSEVDMLEIDVSSFSKGIYVINIKTDHSVFIKKLLIQ